MRVAAAILAIAALSFFVFPGHTYLQQDTQIYAPILENQWNGALAKDLLVQRPHVNFTLYDELTNSLRWVTRAPLGVVLQGEQLLFRALGFWGVFLIAVSFGLEEGAAVAVAAVSALGAVISGPAVLTVEYEPTPRAFAAPLLLLAIGWLLRCRWSLAGLAIAGAFLLHAPTTWPVLLAMFGLAIARPRASLAFIFPGVAVILLVWIGLAQSVSESQDFFDAIPAQQEMLQRMRAAYNYVSTWWLAWMGQYCLFAGIAFLALWRVHAGRDHWVLLGGLTAIGLLSVPLSAMLLEYARLSAIPQIQPARALLFVSLAAVILSSVAGCRAANARRFGEGAAWFGFALLLSAHARFFELPSLRAALVVIGLSPMLAVLRTRGRAVTALLIAPALAVLGGGVSYRTLETPDLSALASWAGAATPPEAVFVFPDAGRDRSPGWFRSAALRAVYVDWKGGGQVNYLRDFSYEWWRRWQAVMEFPRPLSEYRSLGIDYVVVSKARADARQSAFHNSQFFVYRVSSP